MGFCTKCGQELIEGQEHICPALQNQQNDNAKPQNNKAVNVNSSDSTIGVTINTEKVKDTYNNVKDKIVSTSDDFKSNDLSAFERGKKIVPDCIAANDGEVPIKQYNIAKLRTRLIFARAEGRLQVTNKRVLFRATGRSLFGKVSLHEEFKIDELAGVEFRNRPEFNIFNLLSGLIIITACASAGAGLAVWLDNGFIRFLSVVFGIAAIAAWIFLTVIFSKSKSSKRYYAARLAVLSFCGGSLTYFGGGSFFSLFGFDDEGLIYLILSALIYILILVTLFLYVFVPNLIIKVKTKGSFSGIEVVKEQPMALFSFLFGMNKDESSGFLEVLPWTDTDSAIRELGTLIDDIQTLGDAAISKWKQD